MTIARFQQGIGDYYPESATEVGWWAASTNGLTPFEQGRNDKILMLCPHPDCRHEKQMTGSRITRAFAAIDWSHRRVFTYEL